MIRLNPVLLLVVCMLVVSCAKIIPPDGGEKDTTPPLPVLMVPSNESVNFNSKSVYIEFDEFVQFNDIYNQLIISPPLEKQVEIKIKRKAVVITFQEELKRNVTYTMSFGEGITDITELNPAANLQYVFSTGNELDSLTFEGRIFDAFTGIAQEGVRVMLYNDLSDTMPRTSKPYYFTQSEKDGTFKFNYLADDEYQLFALKEANRNYLFDDPTEEIAFFDRPIRLGVDTSKVLLRLSMETDTNQYVSSWEADSSGFLRIALNTPWNRGSRLIPVGLEPTKAQIWDGGDTLFAWIDEPSVQDVSWVFSERSYADTIQYVQSQVAKKTLQLAKGAPGAFDMQDSLTLVFQRPIASFLSDSIQVLRDSIAVDGGVALTSNPFEVKLFGDFEEGVSYDFTILPNAIRSREGWINDTLAFQAKVYELSHFGNVLLTLDASEEVSNGILELYNTNGTVVKRLPVGGEVSFELNRLMPATYKLRLIFDANNNDEWDTVNFDDKAQPERVINLDQDIVVRSNWDMEVDWKLDL